MNLDRQAWEVYFGGDQWDEAARRRAQEAEFQRQGLGYMLQGEVEKANYALSVQAEIESMVREVGCV